MGLADCNTLKKGSSPRKEIGFCFVTENGLEVSLFDVEIVVAFENKNAIFVGNISNQGDAKVWEEDGRTKESLKFWE